MLRTEADIRRSINSRNIFLQVFLGGALLMALGGVLAFAVPVVTATLVFLVGIVVAMIGLLMTQRGIGREKLKEENLDEYERDRHLRARSLAMNVAIVSLGAVMTVLLFMPLFATSVMPRPGVPWWDMVRGLGMIAGALMFVVSYVYLRAITTALNADDRALLED